MSLYSYKGQYPKPLPNRIILSNGNTRTDNTTFTEEEIKDAGYVYIGDIPKCFVNEKVEWNGNNFVIVDISEKIKEQERYKEKLAKEKLLNEIIVDVAGLKFDGNETARNNMLSLIQASQLLTIESTYWKLADNTVAEVTLDDIKKALVLSIQRVGEIVMSV